MDPLSQAFIGASAAQSLVKRGSDRNKMRLALLAGVLGGMAPDLDVLIRSSTDQLLAVQYHRHFTHSLAFVPIGGALVGLLVFAFLKKFFPRSILGLSWKTSVLFATAGFATHGLLDACTSYGTQLFWPFSNFRVAWNNIGIIDPVPTFTWIIGSIVAFMKRDSRWARASLLIALIYLGLGVFQRERAFEVQSKIMAERGHVTQKRSIKPTIFQIFVWKSIYEFEGRYYSDGIHVGLGSTKIYAGDTAGVLKFDKAQLNPDFGRQVKSTLENDLDRFHWFSDGWVARIPSRESAGFVVVGDVRYSLLPQSLDPLWGIRFSPETPDQHVQWVTFRNVTDRSFDTFGKMIRGEDL